MIDHIRKQHNKNLLLYHFVFPIKYRKEVLTPQVSDSLVAVCKQIQLRYEIYFIEVGSDSDHVHFLIQSIPSLSVVKIVTIVKSLTAKQIFCLHPELKKMLWGGNFWTAGYYVNTVSHFGNLTTITEYVKNQGKEYNRLHQSNLFTLF